MMDNDANGTFGACKCEAKEELTLLRDEMQLKDDEIAVLRRRLTYSEEAVKRQT